MNLPCLCPTILAATLAGALSSGAHAQTQWIVDIGGQGDFTSVQAAVDAAAPGDQVFVSPGDYRAEGLILVFKRLTIHGLVPEEPPVLDEVWVANVQSVSLSRLSFSEIDLDSVSGVVHLSEIELDTIWIDDCPSVFAASLHSTEFVRVNAGTRAVFRDCLLEGRDIGGEFGGNGLDVASGASVWLDGTTLIGGGAGAQPDPFGGKEPGRPGSALNLEDGATAVIHGRGTSRLIEGPCYQPGCLPSHAIEASLGASVSISGAPLEGGVFLIAPFGSTDFPQFDYEMPGRPALALRDWPTPPGSTSTVELFGEAGAPAVLFASPMLASPLPLPGLVGEIWGAAPLQVVAGATLGGFEDPIEVPIASPPSVSPPTTTPLLQLLAVSTVDAPFSSEASSLMLGDDERLRLAATGDLNGDGLDDLVAVRSIKTSPFDARVVWLVNPGETGGHWIANEITEEEIDLNGVRLGDADGDGDLDLFASDDELVRWWRNTDGRGSFLEAPTTVLSLEDTDLEDFELADFDSDGDLDLLFLDAPPFPFQPQVSGLWVIENEGSGPAGTAPAKLLDLDVARSIEFADGDLDGDPDVAIVTSDGALRLYSNTGAAFGPSVQVVDAPNPQTSEPRTVEAWFADIDVDGSPDLVVELRDFDLGLAEPPTQFPSQPGRSLVWFRNQGGGAGPESTPRLIRSELAAKVVGPADLDGDGRPDMVAGAGGFFSLFRLMNLGGDEEWPLTHTMLPTSDLGLFTSGIGFGTGLGFDSGLGIAVIPAAGQSESAIYAGGPELQVSRGSGTTLATQLSLPLVPLFEPSLDCDGDGIPDQVAIQLGQATDANGNGIVDGCETTSP